MLQQNEKITALYCRLSQEDELAASPAVSSTKSRY